MYCMRFCIGHLVSRPNRSRHSESRAASVPGPTLGLASWAARQARYSAWSRCSRLSRFSCHRARRSAPPLVPSLALTRPRPRRPPRPRVFSKACSTTLSSFRLAARLPLITLPTLCSALRPRSLAALGRGGPGGGVGGPGGGAGNHGLVTSRTARAASKRASVAAQARTTCLLLSPIRPLYWPAFCSPGFISLPDITSQTRSPPGQQPAGAPVTQSHQQNYINLS